MEKLEIGFVVFVVLRTILDVAANKSNVAPTIIISGDVIGTIVTKHFAAPSEYFIGFFSVDHHAVVPGRKVLESGIKLAGEKRFFVMKVALHRIDEFRSILFCLGIPLLDRSGMFEAYCECKASQRTHADFIAGLPDFAVYFDRGSVVAIFSAVGNGHFNEKIIGRKHILDEILLFPSLLGEGCKLCWSSFGKNGIAG